MLSTPSNMYKTARIFFCALHSQDSFMSIFLDGFPPKPSRCTKKKQVAMDQAAETRRCVICLQNHPLRPFPARPIIATCTNSSDICLHDLGQYLEMQVMTGGALVCPLCPEKLTKDDVQLFGTSKTFEGYLFNTYPPTPTESFCPICVGSQTYVHTGLEAPYRLSCCGCGHEMCSRHEPRDWHKCVTCQRYERKRTRRSGILQEIATKAATDDDLLFDKETWREITESKECLDQHQIYL